MTQTYKALLLASAMLAIGALAVFDVVPEYVAQFGPVALLALFPSAWMGQSRRCSWQRGA